MKCRISGCGLELVIRPVQGAAHYPTCRTCPEHGYNGFSNTRNERGRIPSRADQEKPNDYLNEVSSPADVVIGESGEPLFSSY